MTKTPPVDPAGDPRHVPRPRARPGRGAPPVPRRHGGRAHARASVRRRPASRRARALELLGLQLDRVLRPAPRVRDALGRPAGLRVQVDGQDAAPCRHRGDPRRRLQPHGRGEPPRPDAVAPRHRQQGLLPALTRGPAVLHRLLRHRQQPQHAASARDPADHGQPPPLGAGDARRRLPLRPRAGPRARAVRGEPARERSSTSSSRTRCSRR